MTVTNYFTPESLDEALSLKAAHGQDLHVIAGGTLFMPAVNDGLFFPDQVMGLRRAGMDTVSINGRTVIGATATMTRMESLAEHPILQQAAHSVGGWAIRNMATVGGNLFNRPPYGDFCVALLALGASVKIQSAAAERLLDLNEFLTTEQRKLAADELVTALIVHHNSGLTAFHKFGRRQANSPTIITTAVQVDVADGVIHSARVALGGAGPVPMRAPAAEAVLTNAPASAEAIAAAAAAAAEASDPITDAVASAWYRRQMIEVQLKRTLGALFGVSD